MVLAWYLVDDYTPKKVARIRAPHTGPFQLKKGGGGGCGVGGGGGGALCTLRASAWIPASIVSRFVYFWDPACEEFLP